MTHKLEWTWRLYATKNKKKPGPERTVKDWENRLNFICDFTTIEDFWGVYNNLKHPTDLHGRGDYFMFRQDILPEWEHPNNESGGAWHFSTTEEINEIWLKMLLALIGFQFGAHMQHICGTVMTIRGNKYRLSLWLENCPEEEAHHIGMMMKEVLGGVPLVYRKHHTEEVLSEI